MMLVQTVHFLFSSIPDVSNFAEIFARYQIHPLLLRVPEEKTSPITNRLSTYRVAVAKSQLEADPVTQHLTEWPCTQIWSACQRHFIMHPVFNGTPTRSAVHSHLSHLLPRIHRQPLTYQTIGTPQARASILQRQFKHFSLEVRKILSIATEIREWPLAEVPKLPRWISPSGRVVLMGDTAPATFPFLGQEAAMAGEDAAVLAESCVPSNLLV